MTVKKNVTVGLVCMVLLNTSPAFSAEAVGLSGNIKTLQASIDSGSVSAPAAIDQFVAKIVEQNISINEVNAFVKTKMTPQQYTKFQKQMDSSVRGINPETLTSSELGDIVGQSLVAVQTEGLYWSGCSKMYTGIAVVAAAVVAAVIAHGKSKSIDSIQNDYNNKINNTKNVMNGKISDINNWQEAYPRKITSYSNDIKNSQDDIDDLEWDYKEAERSYYYATTDSDRKYYSDKMNSIQTSIKNEYSDIDYDNDMISYYSSKMSVYNANPAQVAIDAQATAVARDNAVANLTAEQKQAVADAPANQKLGSQLKIGAGIGAAIGAGLIVKGYKEGSYCF